MDNQLLRAILHELYASDPDLRRQESELITLIQKMHETKPNVVIDARRIREIREQVLTHAEKSWQQKNVFTTIQQFFTMKRPIIIGVATACLLLAVPLLYQAYGSKNTVFLNSTDQSIFLLKEGAFGPLTAAPGAGGLGGSGRTSAAATNRAQETGASTKDAMMIAPEIAPYTYVYTGAPLTAPAEKISVFRRKKGQSVSLPTNIRGLGGSKIDLSRFRNLGMNQMTLAQNENLGYMITLDFLEDMISINEYWPQWDAQQQREVAPLKETELIDDATLIRMAADFLKQYGVDTARYGVPEVQNQWRVWYEDAKIKNPGDTSMAYIPEILTVVFPIQIDGQKVYDEGGSPTGLQISINLRHKRVSNVWNLTSEQYEQSLYGAETDINRIKAVAERGGWSGGFWGPIAASTQTIELGTPTLSHIKVWQYADGVSHELIVPAYVFPIVKKPDMTDIYQTSIIVPLAKELLDQRDNSIGGGEVMPLEKLRG